MKLWIPVFALAALRLATTATVQAAEPVGVVANIKVLSDKVEDVSSVEAWKRSYIKDGMSDQDKALAIWKTVTKFRFQTYPPCEGIESDGGHVHDAIKMFNVYGYCQCCCSAACVEYLGRCVGMETRGWSINTHSVAEVKYGGTWHMLDGAYMEYWLNGQGQIASVEEINRAVMDWYKANPAARGKAAEYGPAKGPPLMSRNDFFEQNHLSLAGPWAGAMHAFEFEKAGVMNNAYAQGYRVNIQLREGERLVRNWSNKGLEINPGGAECMGPVDKPIQAALGDRAPLRIGNGTHEYTVPLASGEAFRQGVLEAVNVACAAEEAVVGNGGTATMLMSTNHGLDYKEVASFSQGGEKTIDLRQLVRDCYDYRLKFVLKGPGTGLDSLRISNDIQHSTAPLPALAKGTNTITFSAGAPEGTITLEGGISGNSARPFSMFHVVRDGIKEEHWNAPGGKGTATVHFETPGALKRIRIGASYRARDKKDSYTVEVSFDKGKTWKPVGMLAGPGRTLCANLQFDKVPRGATKGQLRFTAKVLNTLNLFDLRIDCDYTLPHGGFRPVRITYLWEENGMEKKDVHIAFEPTKTYTINLAAEPKLKSIVLELARDGR
jgi:hypothetical protein